MVHSGKTQDWLRTSAVRVRADPHVPRHGGDDGFQRTSAHRPSRLSHRYPPYPNTVQPELIWGLGSPGQRHTLPSNREKPSSPVANTYRLLHTASAIQAGTTPPASARHRHPVLPVMPARRHAATVPSPLVSSSQCLASAFRWRFRSRRAPAQPDNQQQRCLDNPSNPSRRNEVSFRLALTRGCPRTSAPARSARSSSSPTHASARNGGEVSHGPTTSEVARPSVGGRWGALAAVTDGSLRVHTDLSAFVDPVA